MSVYYGYKNRLWKSINTFSFTGAPQQFTLQPGTYLLECKGALGGLSKQLNSVRAYGGVAYGILSLEEATTLYAYVGGNGEDVPDEQPTAGRGGWNGGGNGGIGSVGYYGGAGGGGASDIRLFTESDAPDPPRYYPTIPPEYQQIEYIDTTDTLQYIDTGIIPTKYYMFDFKASFSQGSNDMCIFGARTNATGGTGNRWDCWLSDYEHGYPIINSVYGNREWRASDDVATNVPYDTPAVYEITPGDVTVNDNVITTYNVSGTPSPTYPIYFLNINKAGSPDLDEGWNGKLYHFRISHAGPATEWTFIGSVQCSINGRVYTTANVPQIACIAYGSGWHGPFIITKENPNTALYSPYGEIHAFTYNGETYYHSSTGGWFGGETGGDDMGNVPRAPFGMSSVYDPTTFAQEMLAYVYNLASNPFGLIDPPEKDMELVPVKRISDNAVGMYDTVSGNFFTGELLATNIFNDYQWEQGSIDSSGDIPSNTRIRNVGYIPISNYKRTVVYSEDINGTPLQYGVMEYDENFDVVYESTWRNNGTVYKFEQTTAYIRFCLRYSGQSNITPEDLGSARLGNTFIAGPEGTFYLDDGTDVVRYKKEKSMLSRIIVAGGSGGSGGFDYASNKSPNYSNFGGGANGGPVFATNAGATNGLYASQSNGYSFGVGQDAADRVAGSYNDNGASGAGGGWYGGYAIQTTNTSGLAGPGGGGSGFVYTPTATLPSGYDIDPAYQLSGAYMCANKSEQASIKILEMVSEDLLEAGDIIKFVASGSMSSLTLNPGVYTLKCKGCDGSVRYDMNDSPRGGYSEGTLTLAEPTEIRAFVGGTGIGDNLVSNDYVRETFPDIGANGGGMPIKLGGGFTGHSGGAGSGATDFRIAISSGQDILPDGYTQLKYFRVNGSQYLDTKYIPTFEDNVYIECCPYKDGVNWTSIGGAGIDQANHDLSFWTRYNSTIALHRGGGSYTEPGYTQTIGKKFTIYNIVNVLYVDGVQYGSVPDATTLNCTRSFYLGCNHFSSNTSYNSTFQYHRFYIHNNDSLVVDMYPCIELATGRVGMYDIIREKFYPGTGGLIAGPTVNTSASEYTRVIVAGGAGGCGGAVGGTGGGTTGGNPQGSSGTNAGPGTQTESPQSSTYYIINGGFGYGGNSASTGDGYSSGVSGGAGGGGWYGGCGTYPSGSSDNQKGGSGGSGFVFTQNARVPQEYELSDLYYLEDAYTTPSSNNTLIGLAEASIEVVDISGSYILCRDAEGIKGFNSETQQWEYIADELTPELFEEYGSFTFKTDAGLLDEYDILVNEADDIASLRMDVVPAEQHVIYETVTPMTVDRLDFDTDYDRNLFDVNVDVTRQPRGTATKIIIDVGINKRDVTSKRAKVYSGIMMSK